MIKLKDVQIDALNLYYSEELIEIKAEAVSLAEKMHATGDYTAAAEYSAMVGKINDELTARGDTPAAVGYYNPQEKTTEDGKRRKINFEYMFAISDKNEKRLLQAVANMANKGQKNL